MNEEEFVAELICDIVHLDKLFMVADLLNNCTVLNKRYDVDRYAIVYDLIAKNRLVFNNDIANPMNFNLTIRAGTQFKMLCRSYHVLVNSILYLKFEDDFPFTY